MKLSTLLASTAVAAIMLPAVCLADDGDQRPPQGPPPGGDFRPGGPGGRNFDPLEMGLRRQVAEALRGDLQEGNKDASDELKATLKAKISEAFDAYVKKEKDALAKMEAGKSAQVDELLSKALAGTLDMRPQGRGGAGHGQKKPAKPSND